MKLLAMIKIKKVFMKLKLVNLFYLIHFINVL